MAFAHRVVLRDVNGITDPEKAAIKKDLAEAVDSWVRDKPEKRFALRHLIDLDRLDAPGGVFRPLVDKYLLAGKGRAFAMAAAGRDLGWLLKTVLAEHGRTFEARWSVRSLLIRGYLLVTDHS